MKIIDIVTLVFGLLGFILLLKELKDKSKGGNSVRKSREASFLMKLQQLMLPICIFLSFAALMIFCVTGITYTVPVNGQMQTVFFDPKVRFLYGFEHLLGYFTFILQAVYFGYHLELFQLVAVIYTPIYFLLFLYSLAVDMRLNRILIPQLHLIALVIFVISIYFILLRIIKIFTQPQEKYPDVSNMCC